jgi:hypothetical protein
MVSIKKAGRSNQIQYTTTMRYSSARQKTLVSLLLVLILILGICCFTTDNSSVELLIPTFAFLFVLLADPRPSTPGWQQYAVPPLVGPYIPSAPDRAPPA